MMPWGGGTDNVEDPIERRDKRGNRKGKQESEERGRDHEWIVQIRRKYCCCPLGEYKPDRERGYEAEDKCE